MSGSVDARLAEGFAAMEVGDWSGARAAFEAVLALEERAEALLGLGDALAWLGENRAGVRHLERAYSAFRRRPDPAQAAVTAIGLYFVHRVSLGNEAVSRGWLARAARLVDEHDLVPLAGWVLLLRADDADDSALAERHAREAVDLARAGGDPDLELCALSQLGAILVDAGRVAEGMALLDEALAGSLGGEARRLDTVVLTSCNMITSCTRAAEYERLAEWVRVGDDFTQRYGSPHLFTTCRLHYGAYLFAAGRWAEAERELTTALRGADGGELALRAEAVARLAILRLAQGRVDEARVLVEDVSSHAVAAAAAAGVHLARGEPAVAASIVRRRLATLGDDRCESVDLLELLAEAEAARGDVDAALEAARRLADAAAARGSACVAAHADRALGRALAASGARDEALACLQRAVGAFARLEQPFDAACARLALAEALGADEREAALAEARAALAVFEQLGAARHADRAAACQRRLGARAARGGPRGTDVLSPREQEILALLPEGLSNREIAARLYLAPKTVEHHVRSVLAKLGLQNRTEAAAYAVRVADRESASE